jgi:hypothetical protein
MHSSESRPESWAAKNSRNNVVLAYWTAAWVLSMAVATFGPKLVWDYNPLLTVTAVVVNLVVGFAMIMANRRYLLGLDEMQQKIFLEAGAISLGVGLVCGLGYELLENVKLISFQPEISHLVLLMCLAFLAGLIAGHRKYQ